MTDRPFIGIVCALLAELCHWVTVRWEFDEDDFVRAWQLTTIFIAIAAVLILLDGERYKALPSLLTWLPPLLLPMQFVQSYGMRDSVQRGVFSFLARRRRLRNQRLGLIEEVVEVNFGNVFFVVTMVAATVGSNAGQWWFVIGLTALTGWRLAGVCRGWTFALVPAVLVCGLMSIIGQRMLEEADDLIGRSYSGGPARFSTKSQSTMLGRSGKLELPNEVLWRLKPSPGSPAPRLLRLGTYNQFAGVDWQNQLPPEDFKDLDSKLIGADSYYLLVPVDAADRIPKLRSFTLRGAAADESPLPLPGDTAGLRDFDLLGAERNTHGTIRISPRHPVIDGTVFWNSGGSVEKIDREVHDLRVPLRESSNSDIIHRSVAALRLDEETTLEGKLRRLRGWFQSEFEYTTDLTISNGLPRDARGWKNRHTLTPIGEFLSEVRAGHCESFASAAVLMLRDAGIPARYAVGFAVAELDVSRREFVIRGSHKHAWCRVWDESRGQWIDFDPTPSNWLAGVTTKVDWSQRLSDRIKWLREDFFIWRNKPNNRLGVSIVMITIGLGLGGFVARRLWKSRRNIDKTPAAAAYTGPVIRTPLNELEGLAAKRLGERPPGQPFGAWIGMLAASLNNPHLLDDAVTLHQKLRFDPQPVTHEETERLGKLARDLEAELRKSAG